MEKEEEKCNDENGGEECCDGTVVSWFRFHGFLKAETPIKDVIRSPVYEK